MIFVALGANLPSRYGTAEDTLREACRVLEHHQEIVISRRSSIWVSAPVPVSDQPYFRNAVICIETALAVLPLLGVLKAIEKEFGRQDSVRDAARVLDLDIISYQDKVYEARGITLPHKRAHERGFVLFPLREVAPEWIHPRIGMHIDDLIDQLVDDPTLKLSDSKVHLNVL